MEIWRKMVDIIVPIYNAFEDLEICLKSVYANTDLKANRLILINDKSPDPRIKEFLDRQLKLPDKNIIVIHNEVNKGFSGNINLGMEQSSENDVLLLNSDTIVTNNWIEKIVKCAYSDIAIGTVTPLSNNATLCSVPEFCQENKLPEGMTVDKAAEIVERCSFHEYPEISVGHGFCLYIKREVIDTIGNFDAETFEKGYGEENDFCNRAGQAGYIHVMCDDTYIYHSGTKSFVSKEKQQLIDSHEKILRQRYPEQMALNDIHVRDNPNYKIINNVKRYFELYNGKKNLLYVVQADFREDANDHIGGTQKHVKDLSLNLCKEYNIFVATRYGQYLRVTLYAGEKRERFLFDIGVNHPYVMIRNDKIAQAFKNLILAFDIDLVHVHHVKNLSFDIFDIAKELEVPVILTMHDFYFVCPTLLMLDSENNICVDCESDCRKCLEQKLKIRSNIDYIGIWRKKVRKILPICKKIIVPDESAENIVKKYYPEMESKIDVVTHGYSTELNILDLEPENSDRLEYRIERIDKTGPSYTIVGWACIRGGKTTKSIWIQAENANGVVERIPTTIKYRADVAEIHNTVAECGFECYVPKHILDGSDCTIIPMIYDGKVLWKTKNFYAFPNVNAKLKESCNVAFIGGISESKGGNEIVSIVKQGSRDVNWFVMGQIGVGKLNELDQDNLSKTGAYNPEDIQQLLKVHNIDVVCVLSTWPETFSYTLSEAIYNKCAVIVTDVGALGHRADLGNGIWKVSKQNTVEEVLEIINSITENSQILKEHKELVSQIRVKTVENMVDEYRKIYSVDAKKTSFTEEYDTKLLYSILTRDESKDTSSTEEVQRLKEQMKMVYESTTFKLLLKINSIKIPGLRLLKKIVRKII